MHRAHPASRGGRGRVQAAGGRTHTGLCCWAGPPEMWPPCSISLGLRSGGSISGCATSDFSHACVLCGGVHSRDASRSWCRSRCNMRLLASEATVGHNPGVQQPGSTWWLQWPVGAIPANVWGRNNMGVTGDAVLHACVGCEPSAFV
jgi:hypothetical protein